MERPNVGKTWGIAAAILVVVLASAGLLLWTSSPAKAQAGQECCPSVFVQWRPGSILEAKFAARLAEDNSSIQNGLQAFAKNRDMTPDDMLEYVGNTYLRGPRLWTSHGWIDGWEAILPLLKEIILPGSRPVIHTVSAAIEYQPLLGAKDPAADIDAVATVQMTFSASPADTILVGKLCHSRICEVLSSCEKH